jgi:hypothetical protein
MKAKMKNSKEIGGSSGSADILGDQEDADVIF